MRGLTGNIGRGDTEFYESEIVMKIAETLADRPWAEVSWNARQKYLDQGVRIAQALLNDADIRKRFHEHHVYDDGQQKDSNLLLVRTAECER